MRPGVIRSQRAPGHDPGSARRSHRPTRLPHPRLRAGLAGRGLGLGGGRRLGGAGTLPALGLVRLGLAIAVTGAVAWGCVPTPATQEGRAIADLYTVFIAIGALVAAVVVTLLTTALLRSWWRSRREPDRVPDQVTGHTGLELTWTVIPIGIVIALFALTAIVLVRVERVGATPPAVAVDVQAFRWGWTFRYPDDGVVVSGTGSPGPVLVLPVNERVRVTLTGQDVNHAFYVPAFLFKRDAIPGHPTTFELTIDRAGTYAGQCAEFCGIGHSAMLFSVRAVPDAEFRAWLAAQPRGALAAGATPAPGGATAP